MDEAGESGVGEDDAGEASRRSALRWLMVVVYVVVGGSFSADPSDTGGLVAKLIAGALAAALLLVVVAAVAFAWRRWRYSKAPPASQSVRPRFTDVLTSVPVVLVALAIAFLSAVGRRSEHHNQSATGAAPVNGTAAVNGSASSSPQDRDRDALAAWMTSVPAGQLDKAQAVHQLTLIRQGLSARSLNLPKLVAYAQTADRDAAMFVAEVGKEPAATADVRAVKAVHKREATAFLAATSDYLHGLRARDVALLDKGDTQLRRSDRLAQQAGQQGDALYHRLGGSRAFGSRIDFQAFERDVHQAQATAK